MLQRNCGAEERAPDETITRRVVSIRQAARKNRLTSAAEKPPLVRSLEEFGLKDVETSAA